ncbi:MAG: UbiA family prenyltransferase [Sphingobacteriales bacterium]|nr:UbiA family prenyltransferase [Sphingobacteriales bacterium]
MTKIKNYLSLIKFSHTIFAMPFALIGFFLAIRNSFTLFDIMRIGQWNLNKSIGWSPDITSFAWWVKSGLILKFILVILCMVFARSAAMAFNRYLDRSFDARNPRTAIREIPAGIISANSALLFTIISCALFLITCYFINTLCLVLAPVALLVVLGYSFTKRFTPLCHLILGLGLSLAPIGAYLAVTGQFALLPVLFSFTVLFWVSGFDIIYALQDEEFDKSQNLYSIPAWLGKVKALRVSEILHLLCAACLVYAGFYGQFGLWYWIGVILFQALLIYQHTLVKPTDLSKVNLAFATTNGIASVVFAVFVITDLFIH